MKKSDNTSGKEGNNILVAYFSHSGNTRAIASQIHEIVGGNIFEIVSIDPYPSGYNEVVEQARKELRAEYKPQLKTKKEALRISLSFALSQPFWMASQFRAEKQKMREPRYQSGCVNLE